MCKGLKLNGHIVKKRVNNISAQNKMLFTASFQDG
jgi:hypothetical protein